VDVDDDDYKGSAAAAKEMVLSSTKNPMVEFLELTDIVTYS